MMYILKDHMYWCTSPLTNTWEGISETQPLVIVENHNTQMINLKEEINYLKVELDKVK